MTPVEKLQTGLSRETLAGVSWVSHEEVHVVSVPVGDDVVVEVGDGGVFVHGRWARGWATRRQ